MESLKETLMSFNVDVHKATAARAFNIPEEEVSYDQRQWAKKARFSTQLYRIAPLSKQLAQEYVELGGTLTINGEWE